MCSSHNFFFFCFRSFVLLKYIKIWFLSSKKQFAPYDKKNPYILWNFPHVKLSLLYFLNCYFYLVPWFNKINLHIWKHLNYTHIHRKEKYISLRIIQNVFTILLVSLNISVKKTYNHKDLHFLMRPTGQLIDS